MSTRIAAATVNEAFVDRLGKSKATFERLEHEVERSPELVDSVMAAIDSEHACTRFAAVKLLRLLSASDAELIYPHFGFVAKMLHDENSILKWNAMLTLANLASVDRDKRLDRIIDEYLKPIGGSAMIDAANTMRGAAMIAHAKPYLADTIARGFLAVEKACYATPECRNVAIGHAINALDQFFASVNDKEVLSQFVLRQKNNSRPATAKKAQHFCKKWLAC